MRSYSVGSSRLTSGGNNNLNNAQKYKTKGHISKRHNKKVHVSRALADKIRTVVKDKGTQGSRHVIWNDYMLLGAAASLAYRHFNFDYSQALFTLPHVYFSPLQVMNSASIMFNGKTPVHDYETGVASNFKVENDSVFNITSQKVSYVFHNNSQRHFRLTISVLTPKNNTDAEVEQTINDAITVDTTSGRWAGSALDGPSKENLSTPWQQSPTLRNYYKIETTLIKIDPGASASHVIHGWSGKFDLKKTIKEDQTNDDIQWKYSKNDTKFVVLDVELNMVGITSATDGNFAGRWVNVTGTRGAALLMEIKEDIYIDAPDIKSVTKNSKVKFMENYTSKVTTTNRLLGVQDPDDEGRGLYAPQDN